MRQFLEERDGQFMADHDDAKSGSNIVPVSLKYSIHTELLHGFVFFQYFWKEVRSVEQVSDLMIQLLIEKDIGDCL